MHGLQNDSLVFDEQNTFAWKTSDVLRSQFGISFCPLLTDAKQNIEKKCDVVKSN